MLFNNKQYQCSRKVFISLMAITLAFLPLADIRPALAAIPQTINYQSRLLTPSGTAVTSTTAIQLSFYLDPVAGSYSDAASQGGPLVWKEVYDQASGACSMVTPDTKGYFFLKLGSCNAFPSYLSFDEILYVGVKLGTDAEATPRVQLASHPYALNSQRVNSLEATTTAMANSLLALDSDLNFNIATGTFFGGGLSITGTSTLQNLTFTIATGTSLNLTSYLAIGAIHLDSTGTSNITSGAYLVGVFDEFTNSNATTVQAALSDFDAAITAVSSTLFNMTLQQVTDNGATTTNSIQFAGATSVGDIIPGANNTYTLGNTDYRWSDIWSGIVHIGTSTWDLAQAPTGALTFTHNLGGELMRIASNGFVGIGTNAPAYELDVDGAVRLASQFMLGRFAVLPISGNQEGAVVYNTASSTVNYWDGSEWVGLLSAASSSLGWLTTGNNGTNSAINFIGTTDNQDLAFRTNNIQNMILTASGLFGIGSGVGIPGHMLEVAGDLGFALMDDGGDQLMEVSGNLGAGTAIYQMGDVTGVDTETMFTINPAQEGFYFTDGSVGIATTSPAYRLDVVGDARLSAQLMLGRYAVLPGSGNQSGAVVYNTSSSTVHYWDGTTWRTVATAEDVRSSLWDADHDTGVQVEESSDEDYIRFDTAGVERMFIQNDGKIGINTTGPLNAGLQIGQGGHMNAALSINGNPGDAGIVAFRDEDGEDIFTALGSLANNDFVFMMGDIGGAYTNSYNGSTGIKIDQAEEAYIFGRAPMRFMEGGGFEYVGFLAPASISTSTIWTLPGHDGSNNQVLVTNGSGTLSWATSSDMVENIYTADGDLAGDRTVSGDGVGLGINTVNGGYFEVDVEDGTDYSFLHTYPDEMELSSASAAAYSSMVFNAGGASFNHSQSGSSTHFYIGSTMTLTDNINFRGVNYASDYSANYTARTLVDKGYVDVLNNGKKWKEPVRAMNPSTNVTLSGIQAIDGVTLQVGDRAAVFGQTVTTQDGIYIVQAGAWQRASDALAGDGMANATFFVMEGTSRAESEWTISNNVGADIIGTNDLVAIQTAGPGLFLASNGLHMDGSSAKLGGNLTEDTYIYGGFSSVISFKDMNRWYAEANGGNTFLGMNYFGIAPGLSLRHNNFRIDLNGNMLVTDTGNNRGLEYAADYSANYTNRTLVDKEYVDSIVASSSLLFANGLVNSTGTVELGGSMTKNTNIDLATHYLQFNATDGYHRIADDRTEFAYGYSYFTAEDVGFEVEAADENEIVNYYMRNNLFEISGYTSSSAINPNFHGATYGDDYSAYFVDRSLVDKEYVDNSIFAATTTLNLAYNGGGTALGRQIYTTNSANPVEIINPGTNQWETSLALTNGANGGGLAMQTMEFAGDYGSRLYFTDNTSDPENGTGAYMYNDNTMQAFEFGYQTAGTRNSSFYIDYSQMALNIPGSQTNGAFSINASNYNVPVMSLSVPGSSGNNNITISVGTSTPEAKVTAWSGSLFTRTDGVGGGEQLYVKTTDGGNTGWVPLSASGSLADLDGDTKIQVEESSDEDYIRFDTAGTERMYITNSGELHFADGGYVDAYFNIDNPSSPYTGDPSLAGIFLDSGHDRVSLFGTETYVLNDLGVGVANPNAKVDIGEGMITNPRGDMSVLLSEDGGDSFFETASGDMAEGLIMQGSPGNGVDYGIIRNISSNGYAAGWDRGLHIFTSSTGVNDDPIIFSTDATERMRILDNGRIAIGSSTASSKLYIEAGDGEDALITVNSDDGNGNGNDAGLVINSDYSNGSDAAYVRFLNNGTQSGKMYSSPAGSGFIVDGAQSYDVTTNGQTRLFIAGAGNVGISTSTPGYNLDVQGDSRVSAQFMLGRYAVNPASGNQAGAMIYNTASSTPFYWDGSQWVALGGSGASAGALWDTDHDTGIQVEQSADDDTIRFDVAGTEYFTITQRRITPINSGNSVFIGSLTGANDDNSANQNIFIGNSAGYSNTSGHDNILMGYRSGYNLTSGNENVYLGYEAGYSATTQGRQVAIGYNAGRNNTGGYGNTMMGYIAGRDNTGNDNTMLGYESGIGNTGSDNFFMGRGTGWNNTGNSNIMIGYFNGYNNTGDDNVFFGNAAGSNNQGDHTILMGYQSGFNNIGDDNIFLGYNAGRNNATGTRNLFLGRQAGYSNVLGDGNVFLGYQAGYSETASDRLYIDNSNTASPLIYGEFDNNVVRVNGTMQVNNPAATGYAFPTADGASYGLVLATDANGAMYWSTTTQSNHLKKVTNVLSPVDSAVYQFSVTNNNANTLTGFKAVNTNDVSNYAGAVLELKGSGADYTNNLYFGKYGSSFYVPSWAGNGVLATDKNLVIGSLGTGTLIRYQVGGGYTTPATVATLDSDSYDLQAGVSLNVGGNTVLGDGTTDTITFNARANSDLLPSTNNAYSLGSTTNRWSDVWGANVHIGTSTWDLAQADNGAFTISQNGGSERMRIADNGYVGIGTSTPTDNLYIYGSKNFGDMGITIENNPTIAGNSSLYLKRGDYSAKFNYTGANTNLAISTPNGSNSAIDISANGNGGVYINSSGNVGIGSTPSSFKLQVAGNTGPTQNDIYDLGSATTSWHNIYASGTIYGNVVGYINPGYTEGSVIFQGSSSLQQDNANFHWDDTANRLLIGSNATTSAMGRKLDVNSSVSAGQSLVYLRNSNGGGGGRTLHVVTEAGNSNEAVLIDNDGTGPGLSILNGGAGNVYGLLVDSGRVGFGTTTPAYSLDLVGDARLSAQLMLGQYAVNPASGSQAGAMIFNTASSTPFFWDGSQWVQIATGTGSALNLQEVTDNGYTTNNAIVFAGATSSGDILPYTHDTYSLGNSGYRWSDIWGSNIHIGTSTWDLAQADNGSFTISESGNGELVRVLSNGNVGVGTEVPEEALSTAEDVLIGQFNGAVAPIGGYSRQMIIRATDGQLAGIQGTAYTTYQRNGVDIAQVGIDTSNNIAFRNYTTSWATNVVISSSGNMGIGDTTPTRKLDIQGSTTPGDNLFRVGGGADGGYLSVYTPSDDDRNTTIEWQRNLNFAVGGNNAMIIENDGDVGIGTGTVMPNSRLQISADNSASDASLLRFQASNNSDIQSEIYFSNGGNATYWNVNSSGAGSALIMMNESSEIAKFTNSGFVVNDGSLSGIDFRVESDSSTHAMFVDATNGYVGFDQSVPLAKLHIGNTTAGSLADYDYLRMVGSGDVSHRVYLPNGSNLMVWDFNTTGNGGAIEFRDHGARVGMFTNSGLVINDGAASSIGLRVEGRDDANLFYTDAANNRVGIGTNSPAAKFHVIESGDIVAAFDRTTNDGTIISLRQGGAEEGTISVSGNTVSYNAFTGSHYAWTDDNIQKGMLVSLTGQNKYLHNNPTSEILYGIEVTSIVNDSRVMGSYLALQEAEEARDENNPHLVMAVGNGEIWVTDKGENINIGDYLISSDVAGHAQQDTGEFIVSHIVARAAESIDWTHVSEQVDGVKHKKISVFFETFDKNNIHASVAGTSLQGGDNLDVEDLIVGSAVFEGTITVKEHAAFGKDTVGQAMIMSGEKRVKIDFVNDYGTLPIVTLTPASKVSGAYWVENASLQGFEIVVDELQPSEVMFNWHAFGNFEGRVYVSNGTTLEITTNEMGSSTLETEIQANGSAIVPDPVENTDVEPDPDPPANQEPESTTQEGAGNTDEISTPPAQQDESPAEEQSEPVTQNEPTVEAPTDPIPDVQVDEPEVISEPIEETAVEAPVQEPVVETISE